MLRVLVSITYSKLFGRLTLAIFAMIRISMIVFNRTGSRALAKRVPLLALCSGISGGTPGTKPKELSVVFFRPGRVRLYRF